VVVAAVVVAVPSADDTDEEDNITGMKEMTEVTSRETSGSKCLLLWTLLRYSHARILKFIVEEVDRSIRVPLL
jgi:hypothetical protein